MSGITGWIDWEKDLSSAKKIIESMTSTLQHRGPDARGIWLSSRAALGNQRLIVIDPAKGDQPMLYESGENTYALTYNGEIFNFQDLRKELEQKGHRFQTQSDTEVLLHAYLEWKEDCVQHINGFFAFGLWDGQKQQLFLARDPLGVKPLFYAKRGSAILFASEVKALLAHPLVKPELDAEGLAMILNYFPLHNPGYGIFHHIFEVRPGHYMTFQQAGEQTQQYWSLQSKPHTEDANTTAEHIRNMLQNIVTQQLKADVPVATLLSGGLDSSGITALAAQKFQQEGKILPTYSVDFKESNRYFVTSVIHESLDAPWVKRISEYFGTNHHTITLDSPELLDNLLKPMYLHDHPAYGQIETSMYLLFQIMKQQHVTVALSGESADEVFGGYQWYNKDELLNISTFPWIASFGQIEIAHEIYSWLTPELIKSIAPQEYIRKWYQEGVAEVPQLEGENPLDAKRRESFYLHLTRFLPVLLERQDRMSMAFGLEVRAPFSDAHLVEYVWNIPWEIKSIDQIEKGILRRAFTNILPDDARNRHKSGYPTSQHPSYLKGVRDIVLQILHDPNAPVRPFINVPFIQNRLESNVPNQTHEFNVYPLERIIQFNAWLKDYHVSLPTQLQQGNTRHAG